MVYLLPIYILFFSLAFPSIALSDWSYAKHIIDTTKIQSGNPPRDTIPALFDPKTLPTEWVNFLDDDDQILSIVHNGTARAYLPSILSWHKLPNDDFGGDSHLVYR